MPAIVSQLKQAIDYQDENAVKKILAGNPGLDLNNIAPGISALWWALANLCPVFLPKKKVS